jgi:23S rRNA (guanosine2251-2'-O)-methyltransferase
VIVYGRNPVREAIRGPRAVNHVWATKKAAREPWLDAAGVAVSVVAAQDVARRSQTEAHQGICAETAPYRYADEAGVLAMPEPLIVALDEVQDPQNLGAICRTAECAGASAVVVPERRAADVTAAVCKASAGAVEHLPVARVRNLSDFLRAAKRAGIWCYGADGGAPLRYGEIQLTRPLVLVLGSEGKGLRPRVASSCDALVSIPLQGQIESLSVAAAAAVLLYAVT